MLEFTVSNVQQVHTFEHDDGPIIFGRAPKGEGRHFIVRDPHVSRVQLTVVEDGDRARITNHGGPFEMEGHGPIPKGDEQTFALPVAAIVGATKIEIHHIADRARATKTAILQTIHRTSTPMLLERAPTAERLAEWFETLLSVQKAATGSAEFYDETVRAIVDLIGLDRGIALIREDDTWRAVATHASKSSSSGGGFSHTVLEEVLRTKQTVFHRPTIAAASLQAVDAFVASPILDRDGAVIGALFGARDLRAGVNLPAVEPLEAQVVQLLAAAVSAGLARVEQEAEAGRLRVQFERVFSAELVRELERNPEMLQPANRTITVLFADLRGFSRLSERLDGASTFQLVGEVMDALTACVHEENGVIIDYYGDGMAAMWNAPIQYDDHASRACRAALKMQDDMQALDERWRERLGVPLSVGIGIHTGTALVGNAGSKVRQKYGPRGHTVNLASRIEGATKYAGIPILLSEQTRASIGDTFEARKIGPTTVVGIDEPVELHELRREATPQWRKMRTAYELAVEAFCARNFDVAAAAIATLPDDDGPTMLLSRNITRVASAPGALPLLVLESK